MSGEKEGPHFEDKESSKKMKEKSILFLIFPNCRNDALTVNVKL